MSYTFILSQIKEALGGVSGAQRTPDLNIVTNSGAIAAGACSVAIANTGAATGTVLGENIKAGMVVSFTAPHKDTLAAIAYNATGTEFTITEVR